MKQTFIKKGVKAGLILGTLAVTGTALAAFSGEVKEAISENDFQAFVVAAEGTRAENITEERFESIVEFHEARDAGDTERLAELRAEKRAEKEERRAERQAILENGDYDAFVANVPEGKDIPSEEVFGLLIDLNQARQDGDRETAKEIKSELSDLGFEKPKKKGKRGFGKKGERSEKN